MKKRIIASAIILTMALSMAACGGTKETQTTATEAAETAQTEAVQTEAVETEAPETEAVETEAAEEAAYTYADGKFENATFTIEVADGWIVVDEKSDNDEIVLYHCDDVESFTERDHAKLTISAEEYSYKSRDDQFGLDYLVQNDHQFFVDKTPEVAEGSLDIYSGYILSGPSPYFSTNTHYYYDMEVWQGDSNNRSLLKMRLSYVSEEEYEEALAMLDTFTSKLETDMAAAEGEAEELEIGVVTVTVPAGWEVQSSNSSSAKIANDAYGGYVQINVNAIATSKNAAEWAEAINGNFGGTHEIQTFTLGDHDYVGINPKDGQYYIYCDTSDGEYVVKVNTMFLNLDQAGDLLSSITFE